LALAAGHTLRVAARVASLGVTEVVAMIAGVREPHRLLTFYGHRGTLTRGTDEPDANCFFCRGVWGTGAAANLSRYLGSGL
jgi:hypothetical protein